jgi:hypothetical protein
MGSRITQLKPIQGFCAETGGALTLFLATALGVPVSTTHTITGAIVGVGAARRAAAVRWPVAQRIVIAWVLTLPAAALIGALVFRLISYFGCISTGIGTGGWITPLPPQASGFRASPNRAIPRPSRSTQCVPRLSFRPGDKSRLDSPAADLSPP